MKNSFVRVLILFFLLTPLARRAFSFEMFGVLGYGGSLFNPKPTNYASSGGAVTYGFMGRVDLSYGQLESGFLYTQASITNHQLFGDVKTLGSYWIIPVLYRVPAFSPYLSFAVGPDFAVLGTNTISVDGNLVNASSSGFKSHFGIEASAEAVQDLGENLSALVDLRYRQGLGDAINIQNGASASGIKYQAYFILLGLQKRLE